jgi:hypothetical protein
MSDFSPELMEAILLSASAGQFGTQLIEETFKENVSKLQSAQRELYMHLLSGVVALSVYFVTQDVFVAKQAFIAFISGVFAEAAIKLLKKKNNNAALKSEEMSKQLDDIEKQRLKDEVAYLKSKLEEKENGKA